MRSCYDCRIDLPSEDRQVLPSCSPSSDSLEAEAPFLLLLLRRLGPCSFSGSAFRTDGYRLVARSLVLTKRKQTSRVLGSSSPLYSFRFTRIDTFVGFSALTSARILAISPTPSSPNRPCSETISSAPRSPWEDRFLLSR